MKTIITTALIAALLLLPVEECSAPPITPAFTAVEVVLGITIIAIGATAIYVVLKCAKKLNQPPTIEKSTNRVDWSTSGQMVETPDGYQWSEPATNTATFYRARL